MTASRAVRGWAATASLTIGLLALTGCQGDGGDSDRTDEPTGAETTTAQDEGAEDEGAEDEGTSEEPTSEVSDPAYSADAVADLLPTLSPGGAAYGESPNGAGDYLAPVTACYEVVADEEDGELINAFYGDFDTDGLWITVVATPDNATGTEIATNAIEMNAACEGTTPENSPVLQESVESGTETVAGAPAGFNLSEVSGDQTIVDARIVVSLDNLVIEIVTGRPDAAEAKTAGLEVATELIEAIQALAG